MTDLEKEVRMLGNSVARLRIIIIVMICSFAAFLLFSRRTVSVHADGVPGIITAKQFVVVDANGNQTVIIGPVPGQNDQHFPNIGPVDYSGLAVFGPDHSLVASLGLAIPKQTAPSSGIEAVHYTELYLQSDDGSSSKAYVRSFNGATGPNNFGKAELFLSNTDSNTSESIEEFAGQGRGSVGISANGSVNNQGVITSSVLGTGIGGPTGLQNCPTSTTQNCTPWH